MALAVLWSLGLLLMGSALAQGTSRRAMDISEAPVQIPVCVCHQRRSSLSCPSSSKMSSSSCRSKHPPRLQPATDLPSPSLLYSIAQAPCKVPSLSPPPHKTHTSQTPPGDKIDLLKRSTEFLVERLEEGDFIGVVSYSSDVRCLLFFSFEMEGVGDAQYSTECDL